LLPAAPHTRAAEREFRRGHAIAGAIIAAVLAAELIVLALIPS
jgi:hypothetical protein